jgi:hypothetical protein
MASPANASPSVVGLAYDLMEFESRGNFGQFERCYNRACRHLSLQVDEHTRRKLRNVAFRYLRNTGHVDVYQENSQMRWCTSPATLVQRGASDFVLVGGSTASRAIRAVTGKRNISSIKSTDAGLVEEQIPFFPEMLQLSAPLRDVEWICRRSGVLLGGSYQEHFFRRLPRLDTVLRHAVQAEEAPSGFEPGWTDRFDFASCEWHVFEDPRPTDEGLFRQRFRYAAPRYVIAARRFHRLGTHKVESPEWALIAALALLRIGLPARYETRFHRLHLSRRYDRSLKLPTLMERCLRSGTLLNPSIGRDWLTYDGLTPNSVSQLTTRLPIFRIEGLQ